MTGTLYLILDGLLKRLLATLVGPEIRRFPSVVLATFALAPVIILVNGWDELFTIWVSDQLGLQEVVGIYRFLDRFGLTMMSGTFVHRLGHGIIYSQEGIRWGFRVITKWRALGYLPEDGAKVTPEIGRRAMVWGPGLAILWGCSWGLILMWLGHQGSGYFFFLAAFMQLTNFLPLQQADQMTDGLIAARLMKYPELLRKLSL